jgi:hypothetical protein
MYILLTVLILFLTALGLVSLRLMRPDFQFAWLFAISGALVTWLGVLLWQIRMPLLFFLPGWQPATLFTDTPAFLADGLSWPYALALTTLALAVILTSAARPGFPNSYAWASILTLTGLGLLAVLADNPLTLALVWLAIDLAELFSQLRSVNNPKSSESVVISFSSRLGGVGVLLWANMISTAGGQPMNFQTISAQAGLFLPIAAGLRLGVFPLHLPYARESNLRRGFGTMLRLISAASSLVLLARMPASSVTSPFTPLLLVLSVLAALFGGWMWLRAPEELNGRPFWLIGMAALAVAASLTGNQAGSVAWGAALILAGGVLFLSSTQQVWVKRALLFSVFSLSALPFSLTASGWQSGNGMFVLFWPFFLVAHALLIAGFIRHALRPADTSFESLESWTQVLYIFGIGALLLLQIVLGFWGWDGAFTIGSWWAGLIVILLTAGLVWLSQRIRLLNPIRAHWVRPGTTSWLDWVYRGLWGLYQTAGRLSNSIIGTLEGDGGVLWTLLFLAIFISLLSQGGR